MYNRYIPQEGFQPVEHAASDPGTERQSRPTGSEDSPLQKLLEHLGGSKNAGGLSGIFESMKLDHLDRGDILLLLIILYLFWESDDTELLITLGLLFLMGL
jgi:hypothetical protein